MRTLVLTTLCMVFFGNIYAQKEKIKGNKIVMTEQKILDPFHTVKFYDNFEVTLTEDTDNIATIEADSNLQEFITVEVHDSILEVKSRRYIKRSKELNVKISFAQELRKILVYNKVQLKSGSLITSKDLRVESNDDSEAFLSIEANQLTNVTNDKATTDLHAKADEVFYQVYDNGELKGILNTEVAKIDLYQKASAKLEGEVESMQVRADLNTDFYGQKLKTDTTTIVAEGNSDCYVFCNKSITIEAIDTSEIYLLGDVSKIDITSFTNEATLHRKKNTYSPGLLK